MQAYIIRRFLLLIFVLFGVSVLIFGILMSFSPELRAAAFVTSPQQADEIPDLIKQFGLDDPFYVQYFRWIKEVFKGNLGWSLVAAQPVREAFWRYFPVTLEMNLFAAPIVIIFGIWLGTISGVHRNSWIDHVSRIFAIVGWSLPTFLFALLLLMIFYGYIPVFSPGVISDQFTMFILKNPDKFTRPQGMNITIVTSAKSDDEGRDLLEMFGMPFKQAKQKTDAA